jgi:hypothetical protein
MTPTMHMCTELDMVMKPTNAHKCIKVSYIINIICLLHVLSTRCITENGHIEIYRIFVIQYTKVKY